MELWRRRCEETRFRGLGAWACVCSGLTCIYFFHPNHGYSCAYRGIHLPLPLVWEEVGGSCERNGVRGVDEMLLVPPSEWEGERGVSGEPDGARGVDEMPPALPSEQEEERCVGDEMVSDGRDEAGQLRREACVRGGIRQGALLSDGDAQLRPQLDRARLPLVGSHRQGQFTSVFFFFIHGENLARQLQGKVPDHEMELFCFPEPK